MPFGLTSNKFGSNEVLAVYENLPPLIREKTLQLRQVVLDVASSIEGLSNLEETLKWGEPSYLTKFGSTIRINVVKSSPNQYALYFHCKTTLIDTFKELYAEWFIFEGNRAIIFSVNNSQHFQGEQLNALKHCISLALVYHKIKKLPLLGC